MINIIDQVGSCDQNIQHRSRNSHSVSEAWSSLAAALAFWVWSVLLNRSDVYGAYRSLSNRNTGSKSYTAPAVERRFPGALTLGRIEQHFAGYDQGHLIGIHSISVDNTCRWLAIDIDNHGDNDEAKHLNLKAALHWANKAQTFGLRPVVMDSNGNGGYHLMCMFRTPVESEAVHFFGKYLVSDWRSLELESVPEVFPKQPRLSPHVKYGNWLRLPGRHHTRAHWTQVLVGDEWLPAAETPSKLISVCGSNTSSLDEWWGTNKQTMLACEQQGHEPAETGALSFRGPKRATNLLGLASKTVRFINGEFKDKQNWNCNLFRAACDLAGNGYTYEQALPILLRGASPYTQADLVAATRTIESAFSQSRSPARQVAITTLPSKWYCCGISVTRTDRVETLGGGQNDE